MDKFLASLSHGPLEILLPLLWLVLLPLAVKGYQRLRQFPSPHRWLLRWGIIGGEVGFTLLVIVVVGHMGCAMLKAKQAQCTSNLRALSFAILTYTQDWDERLPPALRWGDVIADKLPINAFRCPSSRSPFGYAFNLSLSKMPLEWVSRPTETVMLLERDASKRNAAGDRTSLPSEPRHLGGDIYGYADGCAKWERRVFAPQLRWQP